MKEVSSRTIESETIVQNERLICGSDEERFLHQGLETRLIIPIRSAGVEPPLFLVYQPFGGPFSPEALAEHLDRKIPVYAVLPWTGNDPPSRTIEGTAARMVRAIRNTQSKGPYRIAGWSFGGLIAFEIALQLIGEDAQVEFVGLFDTENDLSPEEKQLASRSGLRENNSAGQHTVYGTRSFPRTLHLFRSKEAAETNPCHGWTDVVPKEKLMVIELEGERHSIFEVPHITALADTVSDLLNEHKGECDGPAEPSYNPLVLLGGSKSKYSGPPMFCVPGAGNNVTCYFELAISLDGSGPVYGLQPRGLDGCFVPHYSVAAAAKHYCDVINAAYPQGPLRLLGHSHGGWIVSEMALLLQRSGRAVESLTIVDSNVPDGAHREISTIGMIEKFIEILESQTTHSLGIRRCDLNALNGSEIRELLHQRMVDAGLLTQQTDPEILAGPIWVFSASMRAQYSPEETYKGSVQLVFVDDPKLDEQANRDSQRKKLRGWKRWMPHTSLLLCSGNHMTVLRRPHIARLADWMKKEFRKERTS